MAPGREPVTVGVDVHDLPPEAVGRELRATLDNGGVLGVELEVRRDVELVLTVDPPHDGEVRVEGLLLGVLRPAEADGYLRSLPGVVGSGQHGVVDLQVAEELPCLLVPLPESGDLQLLWRVAIGRQDRLKLGWSRRVGLAVGDGLDALGRLVGWPHTSVHQSAQVEHGSRVATEVLYRCFHDVFSLAPAVYPSSHRLCLKVSAEAEDGTAAA